MFVFDERASIVERNAAARHEVRCSRPTGRVTDAVRRLKQHVRREIDLAELPQAEIPDDDQLLTQANLHPFVALPLGWFIDGKRHVDRLGQRLVLTAYLNARRHCSIP